MIWRNILMFWMEQHYYYFFKSKKSWNNKVQWINYQRRADSLSLPYKNHLDGKRNSALILCDFRRSLITIHFLFYKSHSAASASTEAAQCGCPACPCRSTTNLTLHGVSGMIEVLWNFAALCLNRPIKTLPSARARSSVMSLLALSWPRFVESWPTNTKARPWKPLQTQPTQMQMHAENVSRCHSM